MNQTKKNYLPSHEQVERLLQSAFKGMINDDIYERDRLFMKEPFAGLTIPVHGISYLMTEYGTEKVPEEVKRFFRKRYEDNQSQYLATLDAEWPGLFCGLAGNILGFYCAAETGILPGSGDNTLAKGWIKEDNLILNLAEGVAGQLLAAVLISQKGIDLDLEDKMKQLLEFLLLSQAADGSWPMEDFSLGGGTSGILLALIKYHQLYPDERVKRAIWNGLNEIHPQLTYEEAARSRKKVKDVVDISLMDGISGIALVFLYGYEMFQEPIYSTVATNLLRELPREINHYDFGLVYGLAGVGLVYTEAARITGHKEWFIRLRWLNTIFEEMAMYDNSDNLCWNIRGDREVDESFLSGTAGILYFFVKMQRLAVEDDEGSRKISLI